MTGMTIAGTYTTGITLSNAGTQNPATVTGTGRINATSAGSDGIYWQRNLAWMVYRTNKESGMVRRSLG